MPNTKKTARNVVLSQEERFPCPFCPQEFKHRDDRNRHLVECTDSRLFCELCSYNTDKRTNLNRHFKKAHCSTDDKVGLDTDDEVEEQKGSNDDNNNKNMVSDSSSVDSADKPKDVSQEEAKDKMQETKEPEEGELSGEASNKPDNSASLIIHYDEISSEEDMDLRAPETENKIAASPIEKSDKSLGLGRMMRKRTEPMPIVTPKRKTSTPLQDLRTKLSKCLPPKTVTDPNTRKASESVRIAQVQCRCNCHKIKRDDLKTAYVKIITSYVDSDGQNVKVIEKKVPK